ncbi:hypothetical protein Emtol_2361 [Emticicia oligotrophica DSM 17448]|uniref:Uncharacterized protein n=1 Tax=Emticicia oligotrophica (strain DSM 17448 / CIP 109782 / MTCC 6937 / GPTSA100-15) TaxID=929562 RepID=A0ABM5N2G6_EMTOG|nr:hypothetical protein [Emticicia oligotrophica]AFK03498.1 hypothetical protein Emtol_2361 [Emticicia oligotrophica DSM 17448]
MQSIIELLKILIPAAAVLYGMYLTIQTFLQKQFEIKELDIKQKNIEIIMPIRLQAFERMILFLERISPNNLLLRIGSIEIQSIDYQRLLLKEIRDEFNHNIAQQLYISHDTWEKIRLAMNDTIALINTAASEVSPDAPAINLSKKIFEIILTNSQQPTADALRILKEEAQKLFI